MKISSLSSASRLLSFSGAVKDLKMGMYVLNNNDKLMKLTDYDETTETYKKSVGPIESAIEGTIYNVYDGIEINAKRYDMIIYETQSKNFKISLQQDNKEVKVYDDEFIAAPMPFYNPTKKQYFVLSQKTENLIEFFKVNLEDLVPNLISPIKDKNLYKYHSSGIADIYANLKPIFCLETHVEARKVLSFYDLVDNSVTFIADLLLGETISPIQFVMNPAHKYSTDIYYIRQVEEKTELVQLQNVIAPLKVLSKINGPGSANTYIKKERLFPKTGDVIFRKGAISPFESKLKMSETEENRFSRFHVADLETTGYLNMFFITEGGKMEIRRIRDFGEEKKDGKRPFARLKEAPKIYESFLASNDNTNITDVTSADLGNMGRQNLIINKKVTTEDVNVIHTISFDISPNDNKVEFIGFANPGKEHHYVPGATYFVGVNNGAYSCITSQSTQTSYPSLQQKGTFLGVGSSHFFLTFLFISFPFSGKDEWFDSCTASIFPTTITTFTYDKKLHYRCVFKAPHMHVVMIVLGITAFFTLALIIYLSMLEKSRYKRRTENDNIKKLMKMI